MRYFLKNEFGKYFSQNLAMAIPCIMRMNIQHNLVSYGCPPEAMWGSSTFAHPQLSIIILDFSHTEANEPSAWDDRSWAHQLISTYL